MKKKMFYKNLVRKDLRSAIMTLLNDVRSDKSLYNRMILIQNQYDSAISGYLDGVNSEDRNDMLLRRVEQRLLVFIDSLEESEFKNTSSLTDSEIRQRIYSLEMFETKSADIYLDLGICYMQMKLYDICINKLDLAAEMSPSNPRILFYKFLALLKGQKIGLISHSEARILSNYLDAASQLEVRKEYEFLKLVMLIEYYSYNGLSSPGWVLNDVARNCRSAKGNTVDLINLQQFLVFSNKELKLLFRSILESQR